VNGAVGAIFKPTQSRNGWKKTVLACCSSHALIFDKAGNLYGTGLNRKGCCGNVFQLTYTNGRWTPAVLYIFKGGMGDGDLPHALALDEAGNLFGTTLQGGGSGCNGIGCGTVFALTHSQSGWKETVLHDISGRSDGATPSWNGGVFVDAGENVYGAASAGGHNGCSQGGCGVVFKIAP
jgi:hypothetical protein